MLFAVATTKTGSFFSCIQVSKLPKTREAVPPSVLSELLKPDNPFSISSIQSTHGAIVVATSRAFLIFASDCPTTPPNTLPKSNLRSG